MGFLLFCAFITSLHKTTFDNLASWEHGFFLFLLNFCSFSLYLGRTQRNVLSNLYLAFSLLHRVMCILSSPSSEDKSSATFGVPVCKSEMLTSLIYLVLSLVSRLRSSRVSRFGLLLAVGILMIDSGIPAWWVLGYGDIK